MRLHSRGRCVALLLLAAACSGDDSGAAGVGAGGVSAGATSGGAANGGAATGGGAGGTNGTTGAPDGGAAGATSGTGGATDPTGIVDGGLQVPNELQALCGGVCQCADGIDNDGDGVADGFDSECTGPADNDEGTFATGIPGDNRDPKWQDCFFDGNSGGGDDGCRYATGCLTGDLAPDDPDCEVTQMCIDYCKPRTPNGCDCFGCCTFTLADGKEISVLLEAKCQEENLDACTKCTKTGGECTNECGECELCPGKTVDDLPDTCFQKPPTGGTGGTTGGTGGTTGGTGGTGSPPTPYTCDNGVATCRSTADCGNGQYCSFGCCLVILL